MTEKGTSLADRFKEEAVMKEFLDDEGRHYYVIRFESDDSGLVLRKTSSDGELSIAEFVPRDEYRKHSMEDILEAKGIDLEQEGEEKPTTQQAFWRLFKED